MSLICTGCDEEVDAADWHDQDELCTACFDVSGDSARYCCGAIYEDGEDTCQSCGEPLV
jgi:hypothetical protein